MEEDPKVIFKDGLEKYKEIILKNKKIIDAFNDKEGNAEIERLKNFIKEDEGRVEKSDTMEEKERLSYLFVQIRENRERLNELKEAKEAKQKILKEAEQIAIEAAFVELKERVKKSNEKIDEIKRKNEVIKKSATFKWKEAVVANNMKIDKIMKEEIDFIWIKFREFAMYIKRGKLLEEILEEDKNIDPKDKDPKDKDPKDKDPKDKDPKDKDPKDKDPKDKDPKDKDPKDKDPKDKDPKDKDPKDKDSEDKDSELPIKSGLYLYNLTLQESKDIKLIHKIPVLGRIFGNRRVEKSILEELNELDRKDLNTLIEFLDERQVRQLKVHKVYLKAMQKKLAEISAKENPMLIVNQKDIEKQIEEVVEEVKELKEELNDPKIKPEKQAEIEEKLKLRNKEMEKAKVTRDVIEERLKRNLDRETDFNRAKVGKSGEKMNLRGWFLADRNPKNKPEIKILSEIEQKKLKAEKKEDFLTEAKEKENMSVFMENNTKEVKIFGNKFMASRGKFKHEPIAVKTNDTPEMRTRLLLAAIAIAGSVYNAAEIAKAGVSLQEAEKINAEVIKQIEQLKNSITPELVNEANNSLGTAGTITSGVGEWQIGEGALYNKAIMKPLDKTLHETINKLLPDIKSSQASFANELKNGASSVSVLQKILGKDSELWAKVAEGSKGLAKDVEWHAAHGPWWDHSGQIDFAKIWPEGISGRIATNKGFSNLLSFLEKIKIKTFATPKLSQLGNILVGGAIAGAGAKNIQEAKNSKGPKSNEKLENSEEEKIVDEIKEEVDLKISESKDER